LTDSNSSHSQLQIERQMVEISETEPEIWPFKVGSFVTKNNKLYKLTFAQNVNKSQKCFF